MKYPIIPYNPNLKNIARQLRKNGTLSEVLLWQQLKGKAIVGYDFHRQKPIGNFIVDFFCPQCLLAIEIDGYSHNEKAEADIIRQQELEGLGISFLRFTDADIKENLDGVVLYIENWLADHRLNTHPLTKEALLP